MEIKEEELIFHIMVVKYIKSMGREISTDPKENEDLFPRYWYLNHDIQKKLNILTEAIEKKCLIKDTQGYQDIIERPIIQE